MTYLVNVRTTNKVSNNAVYRLFVGTKNRTSIFFRTRSAAIAAAEAIVNDLKLQIVPVERDRNPPPSILSP